MQAIYSANYQLKSWQELRIFEVKEESFKRVKVVSSDAFQKYSSARNRTII